MVKIFYKLRTEFYIYVSRINNHTDQTNIVCFQIVLSKF